MKNLVLSLSLILSLNALAQDMSQTEDWDDVYEDRDGGYLYRGGCSLHEHYKDSLYNLTSSIVDYIEPYDLTTKEFKKNLENLDPKLFRKFNRDQGSDLLRRADDLVIDKVSHSMFPNLELIRFNVGTGGGNGTILFYARMTNGEKVTYKKVAETFDGDVLYCDLSVWLKK